MRIYIAASYARREEMLAKSKTLIASGHEITSRWLLGDQHLGPAVDAQHDIIDLMAAECVLSFTQRPVDGYTSGGRHVEFGIAIAAARRCIVIGPRENVFHHLPQVEHYATWEDALMALARVQSEREIKLGEWARRALPLLLKVQALEPWHPGHFLTLTELINEAAAL